MSTITQWKVEDRVFSAQGSAVMHRNWRRTFGEEHEIVPIEVVPDENDLSDEEVAEMLAEAEPVDIVRFNDLPITTLRKMASQKGLKGAYKGYSKTALVEYLEGLL